MTSIVGLSAFYHDSAACLVVDGAIRAAAQEERFTRRRHDAGFPAKAVDWCLSSCGVAPDALDYVAFYEKPFARFERLLETYLAYAPEGLASFVRAMPGWLRQKGRLPGVIRRGVGGRGAWPLVFVEHHESHAASAFFPSPFDEAAILTLDGVGEWTTAAIGVGRGQRIELTRQLQFPHSLGLLYSAFTYYCGFTVNSGEYKLMGLAPYGKPMYKDLITTHLIDVRPDGSFWLDMRYFNFCQGLTMTGRRFHELFGGPPRQPESRIDQRHMDLAASIQAVTDDVVLAIGREAHRATGQRRLVMAGGVALNCVSNGRLLRDGPFDDIWIQPAAGDAGGALGAALFVWHQLLGRERHAAPGDSQHGSALGPAYSTDEVCRALDEFGAVYRRLLDKDAVVHEAAELLAAGQVVGWFQGRMEFGPRALGARSILGDARAPDMQKRMNLKIKFRESFRPFAPAIRRDDASQWFDMRPGAESPYMLTVASVLPDRRAAIPAVTHVDHSARVQTVDPARHPRFAKLLDAFNARTGCPLLINTSFNVRAEPIVCTPADAYRCFIHTDIDALVIEDVVLRKSDVPNLEAARAAAGPARVTHGMD